MIRVLRVSRLLKLVKSFQGLQKVIDTMIITLPSLLNVVALFALLLFIYSILGNFIFKQVRVGNSIQEYRNFWNFHNSILSLFIFSTGEDWPSAMFDLSRTSDCTEGVDCGTGKDEYSDYFFFLRKLSPRTPS